jgi:ATP-dependent DNA helicase RecG
MKVVFYKDKFTKEFLQKMGLNERQIKAVIYVKKEGQITNKNYQQLLPDISRATATRDLTELVDKGIFEMVGRGKRDLHYVLMRQK